MTDQPTFPRSGPPVLFGAIAVGLLFAAIGGIEVSVSSGAQPDQPAATASVQTGFAPGSALLGLLVGAPLGGLVGALWGCRGLAGAVGFVLVTLVSGLAGLVVAGLLGAQTQVSVTGNAVTVDHGAPPAVLVGGAALGLVLGALGAWRFGFPARRQVSVESEVRHRHATGGWRSCAQVLRWSSW